MLGDLRSPKVVVTNANQVKIIDFNWAGEEGQVRYPYVISSEIDWPEGVQAIAVIKRDHDLEMLDRLISA